MKSLAAAFCMCALLSCSSNHYLTHENWNCIENQSDGTDKMILKFENASVTTKAASISLKGFVLKKDQTPMAGARIQFGVWKTVEDGAFFIIREEFESDASGRFDFVTTLQSDEWMVIEYADISRFFEIGQVLRKIECSDD
ncbi:hypothetical protein K1X84_04910 [bacterium]|nr:hypothetical protein [bacterium]